MLSVSAHPVFKNPKFNSLSPCDKTTYLSFKLQSYFNSKNNFCADANGISTKIYSHNVCVYDFYNDIVHLFEPSYKLVENKQFVGKPIRINDGLKRLLKHRDLEHAFQSCFETFVAPIFAKLKSDVDAKKQLELARVAEYKQTMEKQEQMRIEQKMAEKNAEKEKEMKLANLRATVLALGAEWEDE
jgi:hypothetical protein